jgi:hypothetical protein
VSRPLQKGFKKENQKDICTDNCAMMHRFYCNLKRVEAKHAKIEGQFCGKTKKQIVGFGLRRMMGRGLTG